MEEGISNRDIARNSAPTYDDKASHSLTIAQAVELFVELGTPRSKRSVQRFCEQGHLDNIRVKGSRGDQFFINRESVERYAEELRQIEAVATISDEARHDAPQHAVARYSAPLRATPAGPASQPALHEADEPDEQRRLKDENLNLRIDNRAKELAIGELNRRLTEDRDKYVSAVQEMSYKLGAAETRLAQLEAPKVIDVEARQTATEPAAEQVGAIVVATPDRDESLPSAPISEQASTPRKSFFGRLLG